MTETVLDGVLGRVDEALAFDANVRVAPVALLWPDEMRQWQPAIERLGQSLPVVTLGEFAPDSRRGPTDRHADRLPAGDCPQ